MLTRTALGILTSRYAAVLRHCRFIIVAAMFYPSLSDAAEYSDENVTERTVITEDDSTITGYFSYFNEGVFQNEADGVNVFDAYFGYNENGGNGGAIYNEYDITFNGDATFEGNTSYSDGGAIYNNGTITFNGNASFESNTGDGYCFGGAIYNYDGSTITFSGDASFEGNTANTGGAIYNYRSTITFSGNTLFQGNTANGSSNAIYLEGYNSGSKSVLEMSAHTVLILG